MCDRVKSKLKGRTLNGQSREIVSNVYQFMKKEADDKAVSIPLAKARARTAVAIGVSERVITKINGELKALLIHDDDDSNKSFCTPSKLKESRKRPVTGVDDFDKALIRRLVYEFHIQHKILPTVSLLHEELKKQIDFKGSKSSLRRILKELGFRWRKTQNNRKMLIETNEIREKRISYLRAVKRFRNEGRTIIFMDESYILTSHVSSLSWSDNSTKGMRVPISKGQRLIMIHAGSEAGFVPNALTMWKASSTTGDYHDNVRKETMIKWMKEKLLPNIPPKSVIVVDNAPYHNAQLDKAPTSNSRKQEMKDWLTKHGIQYSNEMLVPELYKLVLLNKPRFIRYEIDELLTGTDHVILRLPPYHPDLNPIELIWAEVKGYVASSNVNCSFESIRSLAQEKFDIIGATEWKNKCDHVKTIENNYASAEPRIDDLVESMVISVGNSDSSDEEDDDMSDIEDLV
ncbi:uncharacterized protein LOC129003735 [Macrosteles quadrilineatus]|uniref:uncharacterized protein LOC129003735 n=1 Tax=Macrosteles quadrilineatus TaxID=74068 RepID=UPI0023E0A7B5|nr:uncharacterized protein LOC129003735 [Macrosteles quadrilineatus]